MSGFADDVENDLSGLRRSLTECFVGNPIIQNRMYAKKTKFFWFSL